MNKIEFQKISRMNSVRNRILFVSVLMLQLLPLCDYAQSSNCIDLSNLHASYIHCTYGNFYNPYVNNGVINGRHTVITQQGIDPETNGGLQMIPQGETYSIRLGNSNVGAEAESISCDIIVDTSDFDLLILKYAAVMEDPGHIPSHQPRFKFDILNTNNQQIDPDCLSADFIANPSLGWHSTGGVLWKDWTNVGVDISSFQGETIRVRLTTYDCEERGHFGYAYFILACGNKRIKVEDCGDVSNYSFSAPEGFNYKWHWLDNPSQIISTDKTVSVPAGNNRTLQCHVSFIGNPNCGFDLYTTPEYRYPIAGFLVQETNCPQSFHLINQSAISNDGINPNGTGNLCEEAFWDFGDGQTSYSLSPSHTYDLPGEYTIMQVAGLNGFSCTDTTYHSVTIPPNTVFDTLSCEYYQWNGVSYTESGTYYQNLTTAHGCDSLVTMNLTIEHGATNYVEDMGCDEYIWNNIEYTTSGQYQQLLQTQFGCDSLVTLNLDMEYYPNFQIMGNHYPIAGTEEAYTMYEYEIVFDNPFINIDSVSWTLSYQNGFDLQPIDGGLKANLYLYAYCLDSIEIKAYVYNRCGAEEYSFWFHTSYFGIEEDETQSLFDIFPNPNRGEFQLCFNNADDLIELKVFDCKGIKIIEKTIKPEASTQKLHIDMKNYPIGVYYFVVNYRGKTFTNKCVISQ